jgi:carbonic anhydrase/acetyltransferase-like protein (isoleucine patch superfamily)
MIYQFEGHVPVIGNEVFIADSADVIGLVKLGDRVSILFNAVVRGDLELIAIGSASNVQDNAVVHTDMGKPVSIGKNVTIGHCAVIHGCVIGDNTLIGINAVVLSGAEIGENCLVGANALVPEGMIIPDNSMVLGTPGKVVRQFDEGMKEILLKSADLYVERSRKFRRSLKPIVVNK